MIKIIKQIVVATIINIILIAPFTYAAADFGKIEAAIKDIQNHESCINTDPKHTDAGYIVTFIEEPLEISTSPEGGDFIYRSCFRNTLQYTVPGTAAVKAVKDATGKVTTPAKSAIPARTEIVSYLAKGKGGGNDCSQIAQNLVSDPSVKELNVRYACKEIQAVLSKGGTSLLYGYIGMIYKWAASVVGVIAVTVIILSGIQMSASGGDPDALSKAKTRILQSIGGIVVLFLSGLILNTINPNFFTALP